MMIPPSGLRHLVVWEVIANAADMHCFYLLCVPHKHGAHPQDLRRLIYGLFNDTVCC
jgi:hypothetical protein